MLRLDRHDLAAAAAVSAPRALGSRPPRHENAHRCTSGTRYRSASRQPVRRRHPTDDEHAEVAARRSRRAPSVTASRRRPGEPSWPGPLWSKRRPTGCAFIEPCSNGRARPLRRHRGERGRVDAPPAEAVQEPPHPRAPPRRPSMPRRSSRATTARSPATGSRGPAAARPDAARCRRRSGPAPAWMRGSVWTRRRPRLSTQQLAASARRGTRATTSHPDRRHARPRSHVPPRRAGRPSGNTRGGRTG